MADDLIARLRSKQIRRIWIEEAATALEARDKEIARLREAGRATANVCFNISQLGNSHLGHRERDICKQAADGWDAAIAALANKGPGDGRTSAVTQDEMDDCYQGGRHPYEGTSDD